MYFLPEKSQLVLIKSVLVKIGKFYQTIEIDYNMLCCVVLCCVVLCFAVLCCVVLCCIALRCVVLCCIVLSCVVLRNVTLCYGMVRYATLRYVTLFCACKNNRIWRHNTSTLRSNYVTGQLPWHRNVRLEGTVSGDNGKTGDRRLF